MNLGSLRTSSLYHIAKNGTWESKQVPNETRWAAAWLLYARLSAFSGFREEVTDGTWDFSHNPDFCDDCEDVIKNDLKANSEAEVRMHATFWLTEAAFAGDTKAIESLSNQAEWGLSSKQNAENIKSRIKNLDKRISDIEGAFKVIGLILLALFIALLFRSFFYKM